MRTICEVVVTYIFKYPKLPVANANYDMIGDIFYFVTKISHFLILREIYKDSRKELG